jgi:spartin
MQLPQQPNPYVNQTSFRSQPQAPQSLYPQLQSQGSGNPYVMAGEGGATAGGEESLVTVSGAIVHLVDDHESVFLGSGDFSVVRLTQQSQGILVLVRVGDALQWPLMSDEQVLKLDPIHYVFSLPVPPAMDHVAGQSSEAVSTSGAQSGENIHYGVTFSIPGQEKALKDLDEVLESYSSFSLPTLLHGDKQKEAADQALASNGQVETRDAAVVPPAVVAGDAKQITEANQRVFWTEMAPSVDDYGNRVAKAIASGAGQIIRGIFWVRDSTVVKLENGAIDMIKDSSPTDKPTDLRPSTLRNLQRVKGMTKATDNFAKSVLNGVISTVGIIPNAIAKSRVGRAFFRTGLGEVALASMVSFWKVFDSVEQASKDVLKTGSNAATTVVTHKHGESAGKATEEALGSAGHLVGTAWSVAKVPKALNPTAALKPSKATILGLHGPKSPQ